MGDNSKRIKKLANFVHKAQQIKIMSIGDKCPRFKKTDAESNQIPVVLTAVSGGNYIYPCQPSGDNKCENCKGLTYYDGVALTGNIDTDQSVVHANCDFYDDVDLTGFSN